MPTTQQKKITGYALFDLDQTLIPWDTQLLFCDFIIKKMPWRRFHLLIFLPLLPFCKIIGTEGMKRVFLNYLWRMTPEELTTLAQEFTEQHFPNTFYAEMLDVFKKQKQLGRTVILSSASPEIWVKPIAEKLGADYYFGTRVETSPRVRLFPNIIGGNNKGANKLEKMKTLFPDHFHIKNDKLPNSQGFSDSHADLPMLDICETADMIHPTQKLLTKGSLQKWTLHTPKRPTQNKKEFAIACIQQALGIYKA